MCIDNNSFLICQFIVWRSIDLSIFVLNVDDHADNAHEITNIHPIFLTVGIIGKYANIELWQIKPYLIERVDSRHTLAAKWMLTKMKQQMSFADASCSLHPNGAWGVCTSAIFGINRFSHCACACVCMCCVIVAANNTHAFGARIKHIIRTRSDRKLFRSWFEFLSSRAYTYQIRSYNVAAIFSM